MARPSIYPKRTKGFHDMTHVEMYKELSAGSRSYIRGRKHKQKNIQNRMRQDIIEQEYVETYFDGKVPDEY